jgi:hypothetical protein
MSTMKRQMTSAMVVALTLGVVPSLAQVPTGPTQANGGTVSGTVLSQESAPIRGALVVLARSVASATPAYYTATSDSNGAFQIANLPPGNYSVCTHAGNVPPSTTPMPLPSAGLPMPPPGQMHYIDSCSPATVAVSASAVQTVRVQLQRGIPVSVIVRDPQGALSTSGASIPSMSLVDSTGKLQATLRQRKQPDGSIRYWTLAPIGTAYQLSVAPNGVPLTSSLGVPASTGSTVFAATPAVAAAFATGANEIVIGEFAVTTAQ